MKQLLIIYVAALLSPYSDARSLSRKPTPAAIAKQQALLPVKHTLQNSDMVFTNLPGGTLEADIVDAHGHTTRCQAISRGNNRINMSNFTPGVYSVVLRTGSETRMFGYCSGITVKANKL